MTRWALLLLAGCGGDDSAPTPDADAATRDGNSADVRHDADAASDAVAHEDAHDASDADSASAPTRLQILMPGSTATTGCGQGSVRTLGATGIVTAIDDVPVDLASDESVRFFDGPLCAGDEVDRGVIEAGDSSHDISFRAAALSGDRRRRRRFAHVVDRTDRAGRSLAVDRGELDDALRAVPGRGRAVLDRRRMLQRRVRQRNVPGLTRS